MIFMNSTRKILSLPYLEITIINILLSGTDIYYAFILESMFLY